MGLFDRQSKPKQVCEDSLFGVLEYNDHGEYWEGRAAFAPLGREVYVHLAVPGGGPPGVEHRVGFAALCERFESLNPAIGAALFELWEPHLVEWNGDNPPVVTSAAGMLAHTTLDWVEVASQTSFSLGYGFTEDVGWDDAFFWVRISDWRVSPDSMGD